MKPISKETIEHADDFIFHLSDNQVKEFMYDLKINQPNIYSLCNISAENGLIPERINFIIRFQLTIFLCFKDYGIKLPPFTAKEMNNCDTWYLNKVNSFGNDIEPKDVFLKMGEEIEQVDLINYFFDRFEKSEKEKILFHEFECGGFLATGILFAALYTQKIKRLLPESSN